MVEHLRSNGLSTFAENVNWPGQAVTAADLRNLMGFKGLREGDQGRNGPFFVTFRCTGTRSRRPAYLLSSATCLQA